MKKSLSLSLAAVSVIAVLGGCTKVSTQAGGLTAGGNPWTVHGVLRWGGLFEPDNMNPLVGNQQIEIDLSMFWGGFLFNWNDKNAFVPELATEVPSTKNGGISKDGLRLTYHLRRGVKWQDGPPFTADDVIYTWQQVMNPANNVGIRTGYDLVTRIEKRDDYTIVVHLKKKYAPFVATFFTMSAGPFPVLPKHLLARYRDLNRIPYDNLPVGTGPFKVVKYDKGSLIQMEANPQYWRGPPKLKEVDYRIIPDENTILTQLKTHEIDFEYNAPATQALSLRQISGVRIYLTPFTQYQEIALNLNNPILRDVRVRRALAHALNQRDLISKVSHGVDMSADSDQPPFLWAYDPNVPRYPYNPARAKRLLDEAGWVTGPDGYRTKNGQPLELAMTGPTGSAETRALELVVQHEWQKIGVRGILKNYVPPLIFGSYGAGGVLMRGKFDTGFYTWNNGVDPDDWTLFSCDQFPPAGQNVYHFCDPKLDAAEHAALSEYDQDKRQEAYRGIQKVLADREPLIIIWFVRRQDVANSDLKNYKPAHAVTTFWNTWEWEI